MSEESESTKDIRRAVCCQLAEALMHSNRYVFRIFRQITTLSFDESQFDDFFSPDQIHSDAKYAKPDILEMSSASSSRRSATQTRLSSESPWRPKRANLTGVFIPKNRYEEMLLVLMLSECIARKDAVLSQDPKFVSEREKTYKNATMTYDLIALSLVRFNQVFHIFRQITTLTHSIWQIQL